MKKKILSQDLNFKKVILPAIYEYLLIVLPVFIYVAMEATHNGFIYLLTSPEWAIASIFLCFQASALYIKGLLRIGQKINGVFIGILFLFSMIIIIFATLNAYLSLDHTNNTPLIIILRLILFTISSVYFFILVCSVKFGNLSK